MGSGEGWGKLFLSGQSVSPFCILFKQKKYPSTNEHQGLSSKQNPSFFVLHVLTKFFTILAFFSFDTCLCILNNFKLRFGCFIISFPTFFPDPLNFRSMCMCMCVCVFANVKLGRPKKHSQSFFVCIHTPFLFS